MGHMETMDLRERESREAGLAGWLEVGSEATFGSDFYQIRVEIVKGLDDGEINRVVGCLGYALRSVLAGESVDGVDIVVFEDGLVTLECWYDSTKSIRDDPEFAAAFNTAREYIHTGTPIRKTDRAGIGTRGTRLVEGIGPCPVRFWVR